MAHFVSSFWKVIFIIFVQHKYFYSAFDVRKARFLIFFRNCKFLSFHTSECCYELKTTTNVPIFRWILITLFFPQPRVHAKTATTFWLTFPFSPIFSLFSSSSPKKTLPLYLFGHRVSAAVYVWLLSSPVGRGSSWCSCDVCRSRKLLPPTNETAATHGTASGVNPRGNLGATGAKAQSLRPQNHSLFCKLMRLCSNNFWFHLSCELNFQ